jgi:hypothetical protein
MGKWRVMYMVLMGKPDGKITLGRPRCRWEDNIKMQIKPTTAVLNGAFMLTGPTEDNETSGSWMWGYLLD